MAEYIYLKYLKVAKSKRNRFRLSTAKKSVENWSGTTKKIKSKSDEGKAKHDKKLAEEQSPFYRINSEIFDTFISFYDAVPLFMGIVGFYPDVIVEQYIRETFRKEGELVQDDKKSEFYRMDMKFFPKIKKQLEQINAVATVANHSDRFFIIGLVSVFDQFIYNLARAVIETNPEIVFNSERNISYGDIGNYKDIQEIRGHIVDTELETLLRESHEEQLNWFSKKLGMKIEPEERLFSKFVELCERRNLFTHTGGRVNSQYILKCQTAKYDIGGLAVGRTLQGGQQYFESAVETVIEIAVQLVHVVWQKIEKKGASEAAKALIRITYRLIADRKYELAIRILEFVLSNKSTKMDDNTRKMHVVNQANAMKLAKRENYTQRLDAEDWSASTIDFKISVVAVKGDVDKFLSMMEKAVKSELLSINDLREWPVFSQMRQEKRVADKFLALFGEPLVELKPKN